MMNRIHIAGLILCLLFATLLSAQNQEEAAIKKVISTLFESMQRGDTATMRSCFDVHSRLQSALLHPKNQKTMLVTESIDSFLVQVQHIHAETLHIEERITRYDIKIDNPLASVWADYEFYLNGKLVHTGVDAFQLFKAESGWKIIQICDTRKRK
jgi:hypothetical protein